MARFNNPLDHVRVASPCSADWDQMFGNDRARFCRQCNLNVYNLSSMTKAEAEQLIGRTEGRLCVRYYRRADGSILTRDCPVGLRAIRRRMSYVARAVSSMVLSFLAGLGLYELTRSRPDPEFPIMGQIALAPPLPPAVVESPMEVTTGKLAYIPPPKAIVRKRAVLRHKDLR